MAKAKKRAAKKVHLVGWSDCGGLEQFESQGETFASLKAAQAHINKNIKAGEYGGEMTYFVLTIAAVGNSSVSMEWKA